MGLPDNIAELYAAHVEHVTEAYGKALEKNGYDALVVHAGSIQHKSRFDDLEWPFKPSPTFAHFVPLREADAYLVVRPGTRARLLRTFEVGFWDGPSPSLPDWVWQPFDRREVAVDKLRSELPRSKTAVICEDALRMAALGYANADINPQGLIASLDAIRTRKTDYERACLAEASRRGARGHKAVFARFHEQPASELELHLTFLSTTSQDDQETPYKNIVALGTSASILHHVHYGRTQAPAERSLLLDAGATCHGYPSDITWTEVHGQGPAAATFRALIGLVHELQQELVGQVRIGLPFEELHDLCHRLLAGVLRTAEIATASVEELVDGGVTRRFLAHGLGHSLGIQVHDVGMRRTPPRADNPFLRNTAAIEVGQVFTIEPGLYFTEQLLEELRRAPQADAINWPLVAELSPFGGIRIEDNIAVTQAGIENLTRQAFAESA